MKKRIEIGLLVTLAATLGYYAYERIGIRMGGTPSPIQSEFASEEDWMLSTIVRDIAETAAYAHGVASEDVEVELERTSTGSLVSDMRLRVWRQTQYHDLEAEVRLRPFQVKMRTFGAPADLVSAKVATNYCSQQERIVKAASSSISFEHVW